MYIDKTIVCKDCGQEFVFTARDQQFYEEKGYTHEPQRCKPCRLARKAATQQQPVRQMYDVVCDDCGKECQVPFQPNSDKPVYCNECYQKRKY